MNFYTEKKSILEKGVSNVKINVRINGVTRKINRKIF